MAVLISISVALSQTPA